MRISGGTLRGRVFRPSMKGWPTRPTTDIAKEALFNILSNRLDYSETAMLDLFGGTGNHSWEFLSRGCNDVVYVDKFFKCIKYVVQMRSDLNFEKEMEVVKMDVKKYILSCQRRFDYIFAGPPYPLQWLDEIPGLILSRELLNPGATLVLEHNQNHNFTTIDGFLEERNYGQTHFSFFTAPLPEGEITEQ